MQKQEIEIIVEPDGKVSVKVLGAKGGECLVLTKELEAALGEVVSRERTPEFYEQNSAAVERKVGSQ